MCDFCDDNNGQRLNEVGSRLRAALELGPLILLLLALLVLLWLYPGAGMVP